VDHKSAHTYGEVGIPPVNCLDRCEIAKALTDVDNCFIELARVLFFGSGFADGGLEETLYGMCADWLDTVPP